LNPRPPGPQPGALPTELQPPLLRAIRNESVLYPLARARTNPGSVYCITRAGGTRPGPPGPPGENPGRAIPAAADALQRQKRLDFYLRNGFQIAPYQWVEAAERYASLDGATLTAYSVDTARGTVTVSVRTKSAVTGTNQRLTATSTAKIELEDGACLSGGQVGFEINGKCVTRRPQAKSPDQKKGAKQAPQAGAKPAPFKVPAGMSKKAKVSTRLVSA